MPQYRKTRIVCISDTHGYTPAEAGFVLPHGDVLIHAGDLSNKGTGAELERTFKWIEDADYEVKIVVAGNHDVTLDSEFYAEHGSHFHQDKAIKEHATCIQLVSELKNKAPSILFLNHESALVKLTRPDGPRTIFKVFGSPYSRFSGLWAFGYSSSTEDGDMLWRQIPLNTDILVTHTPPLGICDRHANKGNLDEINAASKAYGCEQLLRSMARVRPMLAICGHVHEGRGYQRVIWAKDDDGNFLSTVMEDAASLPSPHSKKQSLIDLTGKRERMLRNTSSYTALVSGTETRPSSIAADNDGHSIHPREETCVVNAAIMAKSWPYAGGKVFNRPIVVDINLPVWDCP